MKGDRKQQQDCTSRRQLVHALGDRRRESHRRKQRNEEERHDVDQKALVNSGNIPGRAVELGCVPCDLDQ